MKNLSKFSGAAALALVTSAGMAAPFGAGTVLVLRLGDTTAALSTASAPGFIEERSPVDGSVIQVIALPTAANGANAACTFAGSQAEGFLGLSGNNQFVLISGYAAAPATATVASTLPTAVNRVVARIDLSGNVNTTTQLNDVGGNTRSVASTNGVDLWIGSSGGGSRYATLGATTSTQLATNNTRGTNIFGGQLYISTASAPNFGVCTVGTGTPTTAGQTVTLLPGFPTATGPSSYDFFFANASTLYVADDRTVANGGGIQKWTLNASTWTLASTTALGTSGARSVHGKVSGGTVTMFATTQPTSANALYSVVDNGTLVTATQLGSAAAANTGLRGVRVLPGNFGNPNDGACCRPDGVCVQATSAGCTSLGGTYNGDFSDCGQVTCAQPGACCAPDGTCSTLSSAQCTAAGGSYNGNGSDCGQITCPQPGGCCLPNGTCLILSQGQCTAANGTFSGSGSACPTTCAVARTGACCATNGTCSTVTAASCTGSGGTYRGDGTVCGTGCGSFGAANVIVYEISSTAANTASSALLREVRVSDGATIQTVGLPAVQSENGNRAVTLNGASTTEGQLQRSTDGHYLVLMGYNHSNGFVGPSASSESRVVARIDSKGVVNTTTAFTDGTFSESSPRGAASVDGSAFWLAGNSPVAANRGIRYAVLGANSSAQVNDTGSGNNRAVVVANGNLYCSNTSGGGHVNQVGTGLPTSGPNGTTEIVGTPLNDAQGFFFSDANTLYVGGNSASTVKGIVRFHFDGSAWVFDYIMDAGGTFAHPIQQLTGVSGRAGVTLYGTSGEGPNSAATPGNGLYSVTDTGPGSAYNLIASAQGTAVWKGVALAPTPVTGGTCYANCDASTQPPVLNVQDFTCFLQKFSAGAAYANCDNSTQPPVLNVQDFTCFLQKFSAGCSAP